MIYRKKQLYLKKSSLSFLIVSTLTSMLGISAVAQNLDDDLALVDSFLSLRQQVDLMKELDIHLRLLRERYPANVVAIQEAKIAYAKSQKSKARSIFAKIPNTDPFYGEMVFTFFKYATQQNDTSGKEDAATMYFESSLKETLPEPNTERRDLLMDMVAIYETLARKDNDKEKKKLAALKEWGKKYGIEIPDAPPIQDLIDLNDMAEKIALKDIGVAADAKVDVKALEQLIKIQIEAEWGPNDYWFFKGVVERARAQALLGQHDKALETLDTFYPKFKKMDEQIFKSIDEDKEISRTDKVLAKQAASIFGGVRYVKGLAYLFKAKKLKFKADELVAKKKKADADKIMAEVKTLLIGRTGAAVQFYLCTLKNKGSQEAFKSILRYDYCRDLAKKWFDKSMKELKAEPLEIGKAYYSLKYYDRAREYFEKYLEKAPSAEAYEAIYYSIPACVKSEKLDQVEKYLSVLQGKYIDYNKKPKDYFTKSCLYLSGVYRTKMNEATDPAKKKEFDRIRTEYYERSLQGGGGTAAVNYVLANKAFAASIDLQKAKKRTEAKAQYKKAIESFANVIEKFPSSSEAVRSFKQMAVLHEYFKDLKSAGEMYEEYLKRVATPDVAGRVDKAQNMFGVVNIYFKGEQYDKVLTSIKTLQDYINKEDFKTDDNELLSKMKSLDENSSLLRMYALDKLAAPKKKEARVLRKELKEKPDDAELKTKLEAAEEVVKKDLNKMVTEFDNWINKYSKSDQIPVAMARLGGLYQELNNSAKAKAVYEKLRRLYPDHEVVKQISLNIVRVHLDNEDLDSAAGALKDVNMKDLDDDSLRFLLKAFLIEEKPEDMENLTLKSCSEIVLATSTELRPRLEAKDKENINQLHWVDYRKSRALYNLGRFSEAKAILEKAATEKPLGPYIFDIRFLQGAIASKENDYEAVSSIYSKLMALGARMEPDLNRDVRIRVEWASAYKDAEDADLIKKGRGFAMMAKDANVDSLEEETVIQVQKAWYLFIHYTKGIGQEINELKKDFLQKFPTSPYAIPVRRL